MLNCKTEVELRNRSDSYAWSKKKKKKVLLFEKRLLLWPDAQYMLVQMVYLPYLARRVSTKVKVFPVFASTVAIRALPTGILKSSIVLTDAYSTLHTASPPASQAMPLFFD